MRTFPSNAIDAQVRYLRADTYDVLWIQRWAGADEDLIYGLSRVQLTATDLERLRDACT